MLNTEYIETRKLAIADAENRIAGSAEDKRYVMQQRNKIAAWEREIRDAEIYNEASKLALNVLEPTGTAVDIEVTPEEMVLGKRQSCKACPVALAFLKVVNPICYVSVTPNYVRIATKEDGIFVAQIPLPDHVEVFIRDFDGGIVEVEPFNFRAFLPNGALKPEYRSVRK